MLFSVHVVFVLCMKSGFFASVNSVNSRVISVFVSDVSCLPFCYVCIMSMCVFLTLCTANCQTTINFLMLYSLHDGRQSKRLVQVSESKLMCAQTSYKVCSLIITVSPRSAMCMNRATINTWCGLENIGQNVSYTVLYYTRSRSAFFKFKEWYVA